MKIDIKTSHEQAVAKPLFRAMAEVFKQLNGKKEDVPMLEITAQNEWRESVQTIVNDVKEADEAFLGVQGMSSRVLRSSIMFEAVRIVKIALDIK